jgi:hypothetical protein
LGLLGMAGVRTIRSLGIDGGSAYSAEFSDLAESTRLANGQPSFDPQFTEFPSIISRFQLDYAPLDLPTPIRVFIGASPSEWLPAAVLQYSIRKHASMSVRCDVLSDSNIEFPMPRDPANRPRTPFSFQRFLIPQLCDYQGRAIYLDSDMLVLKDLRSLWKMPFNTADLLCINATDEKQKLSRFSVMLMDCERLRWNIKDLIGDLDDGTYTYQSLVYEMAAAKEVSGRISPIWNSVDTFQRGVTALVHYSDMNRQPWLHDSHPAAYLWLSYLKEAVEAKAVSLTDVQREIENGHVSESLLLQLA